MNYWDKLEPTDENISRLFCFHRESESLPYIRMDNKVDRRYSGIY